MPDVTDATPEPGSPRMVVVLGAPRSGTTWLQHLLASHPLVATMPEPHLFALYVYPLLQTWDRQRAEVSAAVDSLSRGCAPPDRLVGLPACLTEAEVQRALAGLLQPIVDRVMSAAPATRAVVEKTPSNSLVVPYIERVVPGALYIHIIRDPRSVVTSLVDVARSWGRSWAPRSAAAAALMWRAHVVGATEARAFPDRYIELRYEDLRRDPTTNLLRLFAAMGLEVDAAAAEHLERATASPVCSDATERIALSPEVLGRLGDRPILEPEGFGAGSPRDRQLTSLQQWQVESLTSDLMAEFGYERRHSKLGPVDSVASAAIRAVSPRLPTDLKRRLALGIHGYDWRGQHRAVMRNFGEIAGSLRPPRTRSTA